VCGGTCQRVKLTVGVREVGANGVGVRYRNFRYKIWDVVKKIREKVEEVE